MVNKLVSWIFIFIMSSLFVYPYPVIISESGTNHTLNKQLVYSFKESQFEHVRKIEFKKDAARCVGLDKYGQKKCWVGWYWVMRDKNNNCIRGEILLSEPNTNTLKHELCHIQWACKLKQTTNNEEYAENCTLK